MLASLFAVAALIASAPALPAPPPAPQEVPTLDVRFVDDLGAALPGLPVGCRWLDKGRRVLNPKGAPKANEVTDSEGMIRLRAMGFGEGHFVLSFEPGPHLGHLQTNEVIAWDLEPGAHTVRIQRPGALTGRVLGPGPFGSVTLHIVALDAAEYPGLRSDSVERTMEIQPAEDGTFTCEALSPGEYSVTLQRGTHASTRETRIESGKASRAVEFDPKGEGHWIFGVLRDVTGKPLSGVAVQLQRRGAWRHPSYPLIPEVTMATDSQGRFRFGPAPVGPFFLRAQPSTLPVRITEWMSTESIELGHIKDKDVEVQITLPAARRMMAMRVQSRTGPLGLGGGEIRSESTVFRSPFHTDDAGRFKVKIPASDPGPFSLRTINHLGEFSTWTPCDPASNEVNISSSRALVELVRDDDSNFRPAAIGQFEVFRVQGTGPAELVAESKLLRFKEGSPLLAKVDGLSAGEYVCVYRAEESEDRRLNFVIEGPKHYRMTILPPKPCPLTITAWGRTARPSLARLAKDGVAVRYGRATPPGTYTVLLGDKDMLAMGKVTLRQGLNTSVELAPTAPASVTLKDLSPGARAVLVHEAGFRFSAEPVFPLSDEETPHVFRGLPHGKYEVRSSGRLIRTFQLKPGEDAKISF